MKKIILGISVIVIIALVGLVGGSKQAGASVCWHDCHPTPTPTPSCHRDEDRHDHDCVTPTPKITVTPTPTVFQCEEDCVTPTPTATPEATPTPTSIPSTGGSSPQPEGNNSTTNAPGDPVCTVSFDAPKLQGFHVDGNGEVTFSWWMSTDPGVTKQSIIYGYAPDQLVYGADNLNSNISSLVVSGLTPGSHVWAEVIAWKGQCAEYSNELDPLVR